MAKNCLVDSKIFKTKRSGRINLRTTVNLSDELGLSAKQVNARYGHYAGCVGLQVLEQEQRRGSMTEPVLMIGGRPSNNPYGAKAGQRITYIDKNITNIGHVALLVLQRLIEQSPLGPPKPPMRKDGTPNPHYWDCHILLVNGVEVMPGDDMAKPTDTIVIMNKRIYAKRIEQGWSSQAMGGVYRPVARWAKRMFGESFNVTFSYGPFANVAQDKVRRYDFPKVRPGGVTAGMRAGVLTGQMRRLGTMGPQRQITNFVTKHGAAASLFGYKSVQAIYPYIELKPKDFAQAVASRGTRSRSFRI